MGSVTKARSTPIIQREERASASAEMSLQGKEGGLTLRTVGASRRLHQNGVTWRYQLDGGKDIPGSGDSQGKSMQTPAVQPCQTGGCLVGAGDETRELSWRLNANSPACQTECFRLCPMDSGELWTGVELGRATITFSSLVGAVESA